VGNLIKDFWTYTYNDRNYFGIVEVLGDPQFRKAEDKKETRVEKAMAYLQGKSILSHMSAQSYISYLNKSGAASRSHDEETYYPFYLEFEPKLKPGSKGFDSEYMATAQEVYRTANYLRYEYDVEAEDILITITNSRSLYLFVNPKSFRAKPSRNQHLIYKKMYETIDEEIGLQYVDTSHFRFNGLIKTPGAYYAGGYVVPISLQELKLLCADPEQRHLLTKRQRSVEKDVPGENAPRLTELYSNSKELVGSVRAKKRVSNTQTNNVVYISQVAGCINHIEAHGAQPGQRNFALVSLAIAYKNAGYSEHQVHELVQNAADAWQHDESANEVASKVRTVFRKNYNFSCQYILENVDVCGSCESCPFKKGAKKAQNGPKTKFKVSRRVIELLKQKKASLRHFKAYLVMSRHDLFDRFFSPEEYNLDPRVIRELTNMLDGVRNVENGLVSVKIDSGDKNYLFPVNFIDGGAHEALGEKLKPYLTIYTRFIFKAGDKYGMMRAKASTVAAALGYKSVNSVYKLIRELANDGLAVFKNGYLFSLYFSSYKLISIEAYKDAKKEKTLLRNESDSLKTGTNDPGDQRLYWKLSRGSP